MSSDLHQQAEVIFNEAIERPSSVRELYLDDICRADPELREEVEALIAHYETAEGMLNQPRAVSHEITTGPDDALNLSIASEGPGTLIGSFRILQVLQESNRGAIYLVQQDEPPQRLCLEIYTPTSRSDERSARFQHLRDQIMSLDHPGVVELVETGTAQTGKGMQHFVVAEYVDGTALLESLHQSPRTLEERIDLILQMCDILAHAHRRGIIHGDIRPGTVLVDAKGALRIRDFAVARTIGLQRSIAGSTGISGSIPTSMFRSPESADNPVDTRNDVFALGMLACQMLWGQLPWRCEEDTFESARNAMLSRDPAAPSDSDLSPDMNAVLLKAVERDPGQRYNSPAAFALDLQRALGGKPVDARCPNLLIDAKAMADRHPAMAAIVVVATILLMVICFLLGTTLAGG
ncbi:MAG: hypothetical protein CMJ24_06845 [Phycisphaerae bacterium]|nr:hypothetical protein [Phycisphaerae bacterium]